MNSQYGRRGRGYSGPSRGGGRGGGRGRRPAGLSGKEIGMYYKQLSQKKKAEREKNERSVVSIDSQSQSAISSILKEVRASSSNSSGKDVTRTEALPSSSTLLASATPPLSTVSAHAIHTAISTDEALLKDLRERQGQVDGRYAALKKFRESLPASKMEEDIVSLISKNQVVVISGQTGCGKTTQVPQFILDHAIRSGKGSSCKIICTQPRRISAISVAERVATERGEACGQGNSCGYQIRLEGKQPREHGSIVYCTTGILLRWMESDGDLDRASHVILDEVHERDLHTDFVLVILQNILKRRPDIKVILMSATINAEQFSTYFSNCPTLNIPGVIHPVKDYYLENIIPMLDYKPDPRQSTGRYRPYRQRSRNVQNDLRKEEELRETIKSLEGKVPDWVIDRIRMMDLDDIKYDLILLLLKYICHSMEDGAILIFLPGWDNISKMNDLLKGDPVFRSNRYLIIPLHSMMPSTNQQTVFDRPPPGVRKIILATNIAETSITIDDVVFVINPGKVKQTIYDENCNLPVLESTWVSKASVRQRRGRAGRVQSGHCFNLFTKWKHSSMEEYQAPEILRTPLEEVILKIKLLKLGGAADFLSKAMDPPKPKGVTNAIRTLKELKALDEKEELTPLGHHLARLPVAPKLGKMILFGAMFSCLDPVLTVAASLGFKDPFVVPLEKAAEADQVKKRFAEDSQSDHIALLHAFQAWERCRQEGYRATRDFCWDHFLSQQTIQMLSSMKQQFSELLCEAGFISQSNPKHGRANHNSRNMKLLKAVLCAGLYPNVAKLDFKNNPLKPPRVYTQEDGKVEFHPKSVNCKESRFTGKFLVYNTKIKSSNVFLHDATVVSPFPLLFFGGDITTLQEQDQELICVDRWIKFQASKDIALLVQELRSELDRLLILKIGSPQLELYQPHTSNQTPESKLMQAIIDLITREDTTEQAFGGWNKKWLYK